ncbi:hypothetical protein BDN71DRAFT_1451866 [Pleurotus eryngii]|uniref:Mug135-like C-terminal domain-containing protein n=1 Tax=Pleurotus eryngii TaxID=5323 RepID=A0A9P5ZQ50_PLEER|nr:hypothetical protein BDN71DRAFT_1451866 [Pleurotus eryngii]
MDLLVQDNLHSYGALMLPTELNDPPSARDVVNASRLAQTALQMEGHPAGTANHVNEEAFMACAQYEHAVIARSMAHNAAPAWFVHWSNTIFNDNIQNIHIGLTNLTINTYKDHNRVLPAGGTFREIPFTTGLQPWGRQVQVPGGQVILPPLRSRDDILALTMMQADAYLLGYFPNDPLIGTLPERQEKVMLAVGCAVV